MALGFRVKGLKALIKRQDNKDTSWLNIKGYPLLGEGPLGASCNPPQNCRVKIVGSNVWI